MKSFVDVARRDIVAGLSVSIIAIPQSIAYAIVAGVPPVYGIYTLVIQGLLGTIFNRNQLLVVGPVNTHSLLVASVLTHLLHDNPSTGDERAQLYLQMAIGLTLLKGLVQISLSLGRLGNIARYFSQSVIIGFTSGAGVMIAMNQLPALLGLDVGRSTGLPGIWGTLISLGPQLNDTSWATLGVGIVSLASIFVCGRISKWLPGALVAVTVGALTVQFMGLEVSCVSMLSVEWPAPHLPDLTWRQYEKLLGAAFALSLLGLLETYSASRAIAAKTGAVVDANKELGSQGWIHLISGCFSCIPGSGSLSRSALNVHAGATTRFAGAVCALSVALAFEFGGDLASHIPLSSLAGLLIVIGYRLIDWHGIRRILRTNRVDSFTCLFTAIATISIPLHYAIFAGVLLNLALFIRRTSQLHLVEVKLEGDHFQEIPIQIPSKEPLLFLQLEGELFFGVADSLQQQLEELSRGNARVIIIRLKRTRSVDTSILKVISQFVREVRAKGGDVVLCGLRDDIHRQMIGYGLVDQLGKGNVFSTGTHVFGSAKQALARGRELLSEKEPSTARSQPTQKEEDQA